MKDEKYLPADENTVLAPVAPKIDPDLLADPTDNTMFSKALTDDTVEIDLTIENWNAAGDPSVGQYDQMWLYHLPEGGVEEELHRGQYNRDSVFPFSVKLDKGKVKKWGDGKHEFFIRVIPYNNPSPVDFPPLRLIFDRVAPYPSQLPTAFPAIAAVLDANIDAVQLTLPTYPDWDARDTVAWIWRKEVPSNPGDLKPDGARTVTAVPLSIPVPETVIRNAGDGGIHIAYLLKDIAGNVSSISLPTPVAVALGSLPAPGDFKKPVVMGMNGGVVDQEAVFNGITVEISAYRHFKATDLITIKWGTHTFQKRVVGTFPVKLVIPPTVVLEVYGKGSAGVKPVEVAYEVHRGDYRLGGEKDSFNVNLERIGPVPDPDPTWPEPVNPNMALPDVYGGNDGQKNRLTENDELADAVLKVTIDTKFDEGDLVEFYYAGEHVVEADHLLAEDEPGTEIEVTIPWAYILRHDNGDRAAHYEVSRAGVPNKAISKPRAIVVEAIVLHPEAAEIKDGYINDGRLWLNCNSLFDPADPTDTTPDVRIQIPDLSKWLGEGDKLTLTWTATQGTIPGGEEILDAKYEVPVTLGKEYPPTGFVWRIPYADGLKPIFEYDQTVTYDGLATFIYTFERNGKSVPSDPAVAVVAMHYFGDECALVRP